jgi:uncharacterized membrane protein YraQ (UPF0718 family)
MDALINLLAQTLAQVWVTFTHNWPFLIISTLVAVLLKLYADPRKVSGFLTRHKGAGVVSATAAAVATPLCSCGTTAVILGMMASMMPWAPIVAFMVASPLTSPEELNYSAGLFGWPFAAAFFIASILLGLLGGAAASFFEGRGWLANQTRFSSPAKATPKSSVRVTEKQSILAGQPVMAARACDAGPQPALAACACELSAQPAAASASLYAPARLSIAVPEPAVSACGCGGTAEMVLEANPFGAADRFVLQSGETACGCGSSPAPVKAARFEPRTFLTEVLTTGQRLLLMFFGFAFIGYLLNGLIPAAWVSAIFGSGNVYSIPLAATVGLPLYINTEASLPLVRALIDGGMSQGAALAFLITGAGTSIGAIAGALTIARWRILALVIGTLWVGAVVIGYIYNILLALHLF